LQAQLQDSGAAACCQPGKGTHARSVDIARKWFFVPVILNKTWCPHLSLTSSDHLPAYPWLSATTDLQLCASLQVMTICKILEGILPKESVRGAPAPDKKLLEYHFVFACVWAFGGSMLVDKVGAGCVIASDHRQSACPSGCFSMQVVVICDRWSLAVCWGG
jgi:hypothetical protein